MGAGAGYHRLRVPVMFDTLRARIIEVKGLASRIAAKSAIAMRPVVIENARTPRGNVPLFRGKPKWSGNLPITVTATSSQITVRAVDWCMRKMIAKGSPREWLATIAVVARRIREGN